MADNPPAPGQTITNGDWGGQNQGLRIRLGLGTRAPAPAPVPTPVPKPQGFAGGSSNVLKDAIDNLNNRPADPALMRALALAPQLPKPTPPPLPVQRFAGGGDVMPMAPIPPPSLFDALQPPMQVGTGNNIRAMFPALFPQAAPTLDPNQAPLPSNLGAAPPAQPPVALNLPKFVMGGSGPVANVGPTVENAAALHPALAAVANAPTHSTYPGKNGAPPTVVQWDDPAKIAALAAAHGVGFHAAAPTVEPYHLTREQFIEQHMALPIEDATKLWSMNHYLTPQQKMAPDYIKNMETAVGSAKVAYDEAVKAGKAQSVKDDLAGKYDRLNKSLWNTKGRLAQGSLSVYGGMGENLPDFMPDPLSRQK